MSYPKTLDEFSGAELQAEMSRRAKRQRQGLCDYCGRSPETPSCQFPDRHHLLGVLSALRVKKTS